VGILRNILRLYSGEFIKDKRVSTYKARHIKISGDRKIPGEVDGEILGNSSFTIEIITGKLQVIYGDDKYFSKHETHYRKQEMLQSALAKEKVQS
jgi:diacylglycerol kinase family enzyme